MTSVTFDGVTFDEADFADSGYLDEVTVDGTAYPRWQALFVAARNEIDKRANAAAAVSLPYTFSTTTTDSDPGSGVLRLNNATQSSATVIYVDDEDENANDVSALIATFDDSTSSNKGTVALRHRTDETKFLVFSMTALTDATGYTKLTVSNVVASGSTPFSASDEVMLSFSRTGDKGDTGSVSSASSLTISSSVPLISLVDTDDGSDGLIFGDAGTVTISADHNNELSNSRIIRRIDGSIVSTEFAGGKLDVVAEIQAGGHYLWEHDARGSTGSTVAITQADESELSVTITADLDITLEAPSSNVGYGGIITITQGGAGGFTPTIKKAGGAEGTWIGDEPTWTGQSASDVTKVTFIYMANGDLMLSAFVTP